MVSIVVDAWLTESPLSDPRSPLALCITRLSPTPKQAKAARDSRRLHTLAGYKPVFPSTWTECEGASEAVGTTIARVPCTPLPLNSARLWGGKDWTLLTGDALKQRELFIRQPFDGHDREVVRRVDRGADLLLTELPLTALDQ